MSDQNDPIAVQTPVLRVNGGPPEWDLDNVAVEQPLEIRIGFQTDPGPRIYQRLSITMRTPGHDRELAAGFLFTEGVVTSCDQIQAIETDGAADTRGIQNIVTVELRSGVHVALRRLERNVFTNSSCGVCGKLHLNGVPEADLTLAGPEQSLVPRALLNTLPKRLRAIQNGFDLTGGLHATALFTAAGEVIVVREDVGRHNAMDKAIGHLMLAGKRRAEIGFVSGRVSFELVQKAAAAGLTVLAAIGAPSTLAVEAAEDAGLTLIGFVRESRFNVYTHAGRVRGLE